MNNLYFPVYLAWSATWALVMIEYTRAAHWSWQADGGRVRDVPAAIWRFLRWYFTSLGDDIVHWWRRELPPIVRAEHSGRWLRLFVGLSAFNMGLSGIATSLVDRSAWPLWQQFIVLGGVILSLIAAQGHLALAWARHPRRWRFYILASVLWMPVGFYIRWRFL